MARSGVRWSRPPQALADDMTALGRLIDREVGEFAEDMADHAERLAKATHPWRNRTGRAEAGLTGFAEHAGLGRHRFGLFQRYPDRAILEVVQAGRLAVIWPTLRSLAPQWAAFLRARGFRHG